MAEDQDTLVCDNKSVVDYAKCPPHALSSDSDLRRALLREMGRKQFPSRVTATSKARVMIEIGRIYNAMRS